MECPSCYDNGKSVEMEVVEAMINPTNEFEDVRSELVFACPECGEQEDYIASEFDNDEYDEINDSIELQEYPELLYI